MSGLINPSASRRWCDGYSCHIDIQVFFILYIFTICFYVVLSFLENNLRLRTSKSHKVVTSLLEGQYLNNVITREQYCWNNNVVHPCFDKYCSAMMKQRCCSWLLEHVAIPTPLVELRILTIEQCCDNIVMLCELLVYMLLIFLLFLSSSRCLWHKICHQRRLPVVQRGLHSSYRQDRAFW